MEAKKLVIGIDIDGVLNVYGDFFQASVPAWQKAGWTVGIITGRPESDKENIAKVLEKFGIKMDFLLFKPQEFIDKDMPNGVWKAAMCRIMKVDILFDDMQHNDPVFVSDFVQAVETTQIFTPVNYRTTPDGADNKLKDYVDQIVSSLDTGVKEKK